MADLQDVLDTVVTAIADLVYPNGTSQPSSIGVPVQVSAGWPLDVTLEKIAAKPGKTVSNPITLVSVYDVPNTGGDAGTPMDWTPKLISQSVVGVTATVDGASLVLGGTVNGGEVVTVVVNNADVFSQVATANDSPTTLAQALLAEIVAEYPLASAVGGVVAIPGAYDVTARVGSTGVFGHKIHRQHQQLRIIVWSSNTDDRRKVASSIDVMMKDLVRFTMPDTSVAIFASACSYNNDNEEKDGIYRRDLVFRVIYDTIAQVAATEITSVGIQASFPAGTTTLSN